MYVKELQSQTGRWEIDRCAYPGQAFQHLDNSEDLGGLSVLLSNLRSSRLHRETLQRSLCLSRETQRDVTAAEGYGSSGLHTERRYGS